MSDLAPLDGGLAMKWLRQNRASVHWYLKRRLKYFLRAGSFVCRDPDGGAALVVVLQQSCPYRPGAEMRNELVDEAVNTVLEGNFHPFDLAPDHTLYTAFAHAVVVKVDPTASSGYAAVSWPSTVIALNGQYGDKEHRSRLVLPEITEAQEELAKAPLIITDDEQSESSESSELSDSESEFDYQASRP
ncbi:hypothetical protein Hte_007746 [Hypoxylon texense]